MASEADQGGKKVSQLFAEAMDMFEEVSKTAEPTNCNNVQVRIRKAMRLFEEITRLVSIAGMFSSNEKVEEIATKDIKYLLLPALLGTLSLKLCVEDRSNVVQTAEVYFKDFLKRCREYEIIDYAVPEQKQSTAESTSEVSIPGGMHDLATMARERNSKIQRFKEQKELESQLEELKKSLSCMEIADDDVERKYYITMVKNYASQAIDELQSLEMEKPLLEHMAKVRKEENLANSNDSSRKGKRPPSKPLQPIIITRDEVQKKVFGAGYPSLPTMTVQEFYDKRIKDGDWPDPSKQSPTSLLEMAARGNPDLRKEEEETEKEERIERDDPTLLKQAREFDEYKDDHRKGWGNRMNRS